MVSWLAVAYTLAGASSLLVLARLAAIIGRKLMFLGGFLLYLPTNADRGIVGSSAPTTLL